MTVPWHGKTLDHKTCSLCAAPDFRRCSCPWDKPFSEWPYMMLQKLKRAIKDAPRER